MGEYIGKPQQSRDNASKICFKRWPKGCPHNPKVVIVGNCNAAICNYPICEARP